MTILDAGLLLGTGLLSLRNPLIGVAILAQSFIVRRLFMAPPYQVADEVPALSIAYLLVVAAAVFIRVTMTGARREIHYSFGILDGFVLGMGVLLTIGSLYSPFPSFGLEISARYWLFGASLFFLTTLSASALHPSRTARYVAESVVTIYVLGLVVAVVGLLVRAGTAASEERLSLGEGSIIPVAYLLALAFSVNIFMLLNGAPFRSLKNPLLAVTVLPLVAGLALTGTRGALLVSVFALLASTSIWVMNVPRGASRFRNAAVLVLAALLIGAFFRGNPSATRPTAARISGQVGLSAVQHDQSLWERSVGLKVAVDRFAESPLWGQGTGVWFNDPYGYPHNLFTEAASQSGIIGIVLVVILLAHVLRIWRPAVRTPSSMLALVWILTVGALIQAQFSGSIHMHKNLYLSLGLLAVMVRVSRRASAGHRLRESRN